MRPSKSDRGLATGRGLPPRTRPLTSGSAANGFHLGAGARRDVLLFLGRLARLGIAIMALLAAGTLAFALAEHTSLWLAFVLTLDTVATVGSIPSPEDTGGQLIKVVLIILGVGTLFYALVTVAEFFVAGHLTGLLEERQVRRRIDALQDQYIICGFGRVGRQVTRNLSAAGEPYVVVDERPENREYAAELQLRFIEASPSDDVALRAAGIDRARAVLACVDSDAENIFITLSARELRPDVTIIARASAEDSEKKLLRAGADRVISPYSTSGNEMARLALHPQVTGSIDVAPEYRMEEIAIGMGCAGAGKRIDEVRGGALIIGVRRPDGSFQAQPPADAPLAPGDALVALGTEQAMTRLEALFEAPAAAS